MLLGTVEEAVKSYFKGTGFDLIGRTMTDTAGIYIKVTGADSATQNIKKIQILDTYYANGKLYQLPLIRMDLKTYGTYNVEVRVTSKPGIADDNHRNSVFIDGIRIYNPAGKVGEASGAEDVTGEYKLKEKEAKVWEVRDLLLGDLSFEDIEDVFGSGRSPELDDEGEDGTRKDAGGSYISLIAYDKDRSGLEDYTNGSVLVEDMNASESGPALRETLEEFLRRGPNNEVYLGKGNAIAFLATPKGDVNSRNSD